MYFSLLGFVLLTALTSLFVLAEFSLTILESSKLDAALNGKKSFFLQKVREAQGSLSFQLSSVQLGITITTLVTGIIAYPALNRPLTNLLDYSHLTVSGTFISGLTLVFATAISMIFGELIPKSIAIAFPLQSAKYTAPYLLYFTKTFNWLIKLLNTFANFVLKIIEITPTSKLNTARSPEEIDTIIKNAAENGGLDSNTANIVDKSLGFGELTAEELMTPRTKVKYLYANSSLDELIELAKLTGKSRFPVVEEDLDNCLGVVHIKQALSVPTNQFSTIKLHNITSPIQSVPASLDGDALMSRIRSGSMQLLLVVDEYGSVTGIVTMEDLIEEIVGDVQDEHDKEMDQLIKIKDGWICSGLLRLDEFYDNTNISFPEGEYDTLAGLFLDKFGEIPHVKDSVEISYRIGTPFSNNNENENNKLKATILGMDRRRIDLIQIKLPTVNESK